MSLRKALDKAQMERQREIFEDDANSSYGETVPVSIEHDAKGWQSPVYSESHQVRFDPKKLNDNNCVCITPGAPEIEHYKVLRTQIMQKIKQKGWKTLMVTSAQPEEGKTLTAVNLAITFAKEFQQTVLLVDCDLKKQDIHKRFGYSSDKGVGDFLLNDCSMNEIIHWPGIDKMTVISGGQTIQDRAEVLGSPQMKKLVSEMKGRYADRYVIFDLPCLLQGADAITFAPLVDSILIVVENGKTSIKDIDKAIGLIPQDKLLGFVLNRKN